MHDDAGHIIWDRVRTGLIPWTAEGYLEAIEFRHKLNDTPKDDWDLTPRRFLVAFLVDPQPVFFAGYALPPFHRAVGRSRVQTELLGRRPGLVQRLGAGGLQGAPFGSFIMSDMLDLLR
jgi:hypothetical protein